MEAHMNDGDEFTFPVARDSLTPERWNALKQFAVRRARAERSKAIHATMARLRARLRGLLSLFASRATSGREAVARIPASRGQTEGI
jgi:hypothetical protein